jgi:hypothetical protein
VRLGNSFMYGVYSREIGKAISGGFVSASPPQSFYYYFSVGTRSPLERLIPYAVQGKLNLVQLHKAILLLGSVIW